MPITLPAGMQLEAERPQGRGPWIWLCEIELAPATPSLAQTVFRMTSYDQVVTWPAAFSSPPAKTWHPFPFEFTEIEENQEGDLPQMDLAVDNTARTLMRYLHSGDGCVGNAVQLYLVHEDGLDIASPDEEYLTWPLRIAQVMATDTQVTFRLEDPNWFERRVPADRFIANRCRWRFGGPECGYPVNAVAAYTTCGGTLSECILRGQDEAVRRLPVLHPLRFGGFRGIRVQRS